MTFSSVSRSLPHSVLQFHNCPYPETAWFFLWQILPLRFEIPGSQSKSQLLQGLCTHFFQGWFFLSVDRLIFRILYHKKFRSMFFDFLQCSWYKELKSTGYWYGNSFISDSSAALRMHGNFCFLWKGSTCDAWGCTGFSEENSK